jgi:transposase
MWVRKLSSDRWDQLTDRSENENNMQNYDVFAGVDVGKTFHWIHATDGLGNPLISRKVDQDEQQLDQLFTALAKDENRVLVVVDQPKNIGALTLACAARAGCDTSYLPGLAMRRAAGLLPGDSKTDQRDAKIIAYTARVMPQTLRPVTTDDTQRANLEALAAYDQDCLTDRTRSINRLHALLAEVNPHFEKAIFTDIDSPFILALLQRFGGPWGIRKAGQTTVRRWASNQNRVPKHLLETVIETAWKMQHQPAGALIREELAIPATAQRINELTIIRKSNEKRINTMLADNPTYNNLLTMPGVGPHTAATLVTTINIQLFPDHEKLASYAGIAARTTQSGTSVKNDTAARAGNRTLKTALYLSAFAALRLDPKARTFYDQKRAAGKQHTTALIALARKRLKIMYAIMQNNVNYRA